LGESSCWQSQSEPHCLWKSRLKCTKNAAISVTSLNQTSKPLRNKEFHAPNHEHVCCLPSEFINQVVNTDVVHIIGGIQYVGYPTVLPNQAIYRPRPFAPMLSPMPARRLEDRIRDLCARALHEEGQEWAATIHELQSAIQEHGLRVANLTSTATVAGRPEFIAERRNR
jgi:hypothetical protein